MKKLNWRFNPPSFRRKRRQRRKVKAVQSPLKPVWDTSKSKGQCFDESLRKKEIFVPGGRERTVKQEKKRKGSKKKKKKKNLTQKFRHRMRHMEGLEESKNIK